MRWLVPWAVLTVVVGAQEAQVPAVLIAQARLGGGLSQLSPTKLEAALTLALEVTGKYAVVPSPVRDSVVQLLQAQGQEPTALAVARQLGCSVLCFALAERFVHVVRAEVVLRWGKEFEHEHRGIGYALVRYARYGSGELLLDPALLEAVQRALAVALGDSMLYAQMEPPLRVYPAALVAVGGISYEDEPSLPPWQLFARKVVTSYEAVLSAVDTIRAHPRFVPCDVDTRDSIYALGRLYEPENYTAPTPLELRLLAQMEVAWLVAGVLRRVPEGAHLRMDLYRLNRTAQGVEPHYVRSAEGLVREDSSRALRATVKQVVGQLLWEGSP